MQYTTNYFLRKPQLLEPANIVGLNANADSIDTLLYQNRHISATESNQNTSYSVGGFGDLRKPALQVYRSNKRKLGFF